MRAARRLRWRAAAAAPLKTSHRITDARPGLRKTNQQQPSPMAWNKKETENEKFDKN